MWRYRSSSTYNQLSTAHIMSKIIFMEYLPLARSKLVPKLKMLRIYWNLAQMIFRISQSRFRYQRLFLLNIYHLLGPNWSQNWKYSEFIEIWYIRYFKYANLGFDVKNSFYQIFTDWCQNDRWPEFIEIRPDWYSKCAGLNFDVKNGFY